MPANDVMNKRFQSSEERTLCLCCVCPRHPPHSPVRFVVPLWTVVVGILCLLVGGVVARPDGDKYRDVVQSEVLFCTVLIAKIGPEEGREKRGGRDDEKMERGEREEEETVGPRSEHLG